MKKLLFCSLLFCSQLFAVDNWRCDPAPRCYDESSFTYRASGEWLYFKPSFDQSEWIWTGDTVAVANNNGGWRHGEEQRFYSAFRIEAGLLFPNQCNELVGRYVNFRCNPSKEISGPLIQQIFGIAASVNTINTNGVGQFNRDYSYYSIEGIYGPHLPVYCCFETYLSGGVKFAHLHIDEHTLFDSFTGNELNVCRNQMYGWAVGPILNLDIAYSLLCNFKATARVVGGVMTCRNKSSLYYDVVNAGTATTIINKPHFWHVIPTADWRIGLSYEQKFCFCGYNFTLSGEGGYEMIREGRMVHRIQTQNDTQLGFSFNEWSDFTLNGPFARFGISY